LSFNWHACYIPRHRLNNSLTSLLRQFVECNTFCGQLNHFTVQNGFLSVSEFL
jgi:hypothetical protein